MRCQSCGTTHEQWSLNDTLRPGKHKDNPYHVCSNCLLYLVTYSLKPKEYKNLIKNGHSTHEFLLHSDFYDEKGKAQQPLYRRR
jgi:hypothetical protein